MPSELEQTSSLLRLLRSVRKVVVVPHLNPDGDAIAGLLALTASLRLVRVDALAVSPSPVPASYRFLPGWETVSVYSHEDLELPSGAEAREALLASEAIVCLDCSDLERLGSLYADHRRKFESAVLVNIDHHPTNSHFGGLNLVDPSAAAVCESLALLMEREDLPMTAEIATALLTGIVADTLGFRTPSTSATTLRVAAMLMERGAVLSRISEFIFNTRSQRTLCLWGRVLSLTRVEDGLVWAEITRAMLHECGARMEDADTLVDFIAGVPGSSGAFLFSEQEDQVRVSIRTSADLDAAELARSFGGGGHARAAGCTIAGSLSQTRTMVLAAARRRLGMVATRGEEQR